MKQSNSTQIFLYIYNLYETIKIYTNLHLGPALGKVFMPLNSETIHVDVEKQLVLWKCGVIFLFTVIFLFVVSFKLIIYYTSRVEFILYQIS